MTSILIPISPDDCIRIIHGEKTAIITKTAPKTLRPPLKCFIYCAFTNGRYLHRSSDSEKECYIDKRPWCDGTICGGKVIGEFMCDNLYANSITSLVFPEDSERALQGSCLSREDALKMLKWNPKLRLSETPHNRYYYWSITAVKIYDEPRELRDFTRPCGRFTDCGACYRFDRENYTCNRRLTRPLSSWRYVDD